MKSKIRIFTDGACSGNPGPGGWAVVINEEEGQVTRTGFEIDTTNNRMELTAIVNAIELIKKRYEKDEFNFEIYSDSAYVINTINRNSLISWERNGWKTKAGTFVKNVDLWLKFNEVKKQLFNYEIEFIKIKGHDGNMFNELADQLAKEEILEARKLFMR